MANNNVIFNAALEGFIQGVSASWIQSTTSGDYAPVSLAAVAFATQVDSKVAHSDSITAAEANLMRSICAGIISQRYQVNAQAQVAAFWNTIALSIFALYSNARLQLLGE